MIDMETIIHGPVANNSREIIDSPPTIALPPDVKAVITALLARCFRNSFEFKGYPENAFDDEGSTLDALAQVLGIDPLDVTYPVMARFRGEA